MDTLEQCALYNSPDFYPSTLDGESSQPASRGAASQEGGRLAALREYEEVLAAVEEYSQHLAGPSWHLPAPAWHLPGAGADPPALSTDHLASRMEIPVMRENIAGHLPARWMERLEPGTNLPALRLNSPAQMIDLSTSRMDLPAAGGVADSSMLEERVREVALQLILDSDASQSR